jgi:hypothetical protein
MMLPQLLLQATNGIFTWQPVTPELLILLSILVLPLIGLRLKGTSGRRDLGRFTVLILTGILVLVL